jgi:hypothetical protein
MPQLPNEIILKTFQCLDPSKHDPITGMPYIQTLSSVNRTWRALSFCLPFWKKLSNWRLLIPEKKRRKHELVHEKQKGVYEDSKFYSFFIQDLNRLNGLSILDYRYINHETTKNLLKALVSQNPRKTFTFQYGMGKLMVKKIKKTFPKFTFGPFYEVVRYLNNVVDLALMGLTIRDWEALTIGVKNLKSFTYSDGWGSER